MSNSTFKLIVTLLVLVIVIGGGMLLYQKLGQNVDLGEAIPTETISENLAPDFTVTDAEGNEVKLSDFRGKGVVLNFWASWCGPCKSEMPHFQKAYEEYGEDVTFLTWGFDDITILRENLQLHELPCDWVDRWYNAQMMFNAQTDGSNSQKALTTAMEIFGIEATRPAHDAQIGRAHV